MHPRHLVSVLVVMALFGSTYPVGKIGVDHFPPFLFAALRSTVLVVALLPIWRLRRVPRHLLRPLVGFCASMGVGVYATMYLALALTDSVAPIILGTQLSVPFAVLLGLVILGEPVRPATWAAIAAAFAGVLVIAIEPSLLDNLWALAAIAVSALFYAFATIFARSLRTVPPAVTNGWMALAAIPPLLALSLMLEDGQLAALHTAGAGAWAVLLHSAIAISLIAHLWMFSLYRHYPVSTVIPFYVLMPVFGIAMTLAVLGEVPRLQTLIGGAVVIAATYAVNRSTATRPDRRAAPEPAPELPRAEALVQAGPEQD